MKILVGFRGKNVGKDLLALAVQHAKAFQGEILVVTSLFGEEKTSQEDVLAAEEVLAEARQFLEGHGVPCETHLLVRGMNAGEDLVKYAQEKQVHEIIIGVRSRSKVGKLLFGSTAQYVILKSHCPVLTVK